MEGSIKRAFLNKDSCVRETWSFCPPASIGKADLQGVLGSVDGARSSGQSVPASIEEAKTSHTIRHPDMETTISRHNERNSINPRHRIIRR
jgi:hypothetical protein